MTCKYEITRELWDEHYKEHGERKEEIKSIRDPLESFYLQQVAQVETQAELVRQNGQSGLMKSRQYNYQYANDVGYAAANIHNHANFRKILGSAEFSGALNGYYFRSRHNDYSLSKNRDEGSKFLSTIGIPSIPVPADITGTPEQQINKARDYFKVLSGDLPQSSVQHFDKAFRWVISYIECWWEYLDGDRFEDPFFSPRHQINADTIRDLVARDQYYSYGGHKNRFENQAHLPIAIKDVDKNGKPILCIFKYRCVCKEVGSLVDYPISSTIYPVYDYLTLKITGKNHYPTYHGNARRDRFQIGNPPYTKTTPTLLDEVMNKIWGLDGEGAFLEERYVNEITGREDQLFDYKTGNILNSAKYNRYYKLGDLDASGRGTAMRGFHDPMLFVAKTTRPQVFTRNYDGESYAFSYAIPFEMIIQTFLDKWNPYEIPEKFPAQGEDGSESKPYSGYWNGRYYYHTPADLFSDASDPDPADTSAYSKYMVCGDGVARQHAGSGHWVHLPRIQGIDNNIRTRYPVYPVYWEGNETHAQMMEEL